MAKEDESATSLTQLVRLKAENGILATDKEYAEKANVDTEAQVA